MLHSHRFFLNPLFKESLTNKTIPQHLFPLCTRAKLLQFCATLCDPVNCSSSVHGILQARILEWVAMPSLRNLPDPGSNPCVLCLLHWQVGSLPLVPPGKPFFVYSTYQIKACLCVCVCVCVTLSHAYHVLIYLTRIYIYKTAQIYFF